MTKRRGWHPEDIKAAVRKTGITLKALALKNGLSESATRVAILFQFCPSGEKAIYDHLGVNPYVIWPDRYNPDGTRSIGRNSTPPPPSRHRQKDTVA